MMKEVGELAFDSTHSEGSVLLCIRSFMAAWKVLDPQTCLNMIKTLQNSITTGDPLCSRS
jgi:hypothetical protein